MTPTTAQSSVKQLDEQQVFDLLEKAHAQYATYVEIANKESHIAFYGESKQENPFQHDLNYPLLLVLK